MATISNCPPEDSLIPEQAAGWPDVPMWNKDTLALGDALNNQAASLMARIEQVKESVSWRNVSIEEYVHLVVSRPTENSATWDWSPAFDKAIADLKAVAKAPARITISRDVGVSRTIKFTDYVSLDCLNGEIYALPGFQLETAIVQFGVVDGAIWRGYNGSVRVHGNDQRLIGVWFANHRQSKTDFVVFRYTTFEGMRTSQGYGSSFPSISGSMSSKISERPVNADYDSIGLHVRGSDSNYGAGDINGAAIGIRAIGNNNVFGAFHVWGVYRRPSGEASCPMLIGVLNEGQSNTYTGVVVDSPSLRDFNQPAGFSPTVPGWNGGYGIYNRGDGFQAQFIGCKVFVPDRRGANTGNETMPSKRLIAYMVVQSSNWLACEITDYTNDAFVPGAAGRYAGSALETSLILSRAQIQLYSQNQPKINRKTLLSKGVEIQARLDYQDPNENDSAWGVCSFELTPFTFNVRTNYSGTAKKAITSLQLKGTFAEMADYKTRLLAADAAVKPDLVGITYFNITDKKTRTWDGSEWRMFDGTVSNTAP